LTHPLPERLKQARMKKGMTQQKLGELLGLDPNNASARMNQYERGKHNPDYTTMKRISDILDVPTSYFYCEDEYEASILKAAHHLNTEQKLLVLAFIQTLRA
jgi:transcriptional regulator with XRE-family HTH domain